MFQDVVHDLSKRHSLHAQHGFVGRAVRKELVHSHQAAHRLREFLELLGEQHAARGPVVRRLDLQPEVRLLRVDVEAELLALLQQRDHRLDAQNHIAEVGESGTTNRVQQCELLDQRLSLEEVEDELARFVDERVEAAVRRHADILASEAARPGFL